MSNVQSFLQRIHPASIKPRVGLLISLLCGALLYYPQLFTFVGTDLGVYYEIGRRFATDGYLALWDNYWDHKPPSYLLFSGFVFLDHLIAPNWGLKTGAFCLYMTAILSTQLASILETRNSYTTQLATGTAVLVAAISFGWLDFALNGVLLVAAVCFSFSGLVLAGSIGSRNTTARIVFAGVLIGSSPLFRPTAVTAYAILTIGALIEIRAKNFGSVVRSWVVATAILGLMAMMTIAISGSPADAWETLIQYNSAYRSKNVNAVTILDFFTQDKPALLLFATALTFALPLLYAHRATWKSWALPGLWLAAEIASMIWQRKIQSFYVLGFVLPAILFAAFVPVTIKSNRPVKLAALLIGAGIAASVFLSWSKLSPTIFQNRLVDQKDQLTSLLPEFLGSQRCPHWSRTTLFVYGNRAQLYTNAASHGIKPFRWSAYANPLIDGGSLPERGQLFFRQWLAQPPEFIVYAGGPGWDPNIGGRSSFIEQQIAEQYEELPAPAAATGSEWPYRYVYRAYRIKCPAE